MSQLYEALRDAAPVALPIRSTRQPVVKADDVMATLGYSFRRAPLRPPIAALSSWQFWSPWLWRHGAADRQRRQYKLLSSPVTQTG